MKLLLLARACGARWSARARLAAAVGCAGVAPRAWAPASYKFFTRLVPGPVCSPTQMRQRLAVKSLI